MRHDIFRYIPASRSRIRYQLLLVQCLGDGKGLVRRQVVMDIAVFLQGCQVVEERSLLECSLAFHSVYRGDGSGSDFPICCPGRFLVLELFRVDKLAVRISLLQRDMQLPVWGGNEVAVLLEACAYHGECRGLHPADGIVSRAGSYRQRTAGVHAHQPVRLRPAVRGGIEAVVVAAVPEVFHPFADGFVCQRGNPQALERLGVA